MERYGKILNGETTVEFTLRNIRAYYDQQMADTCPDGYKLVERVLPYPKIEKGKQMMFRVTDLGDKLKKECWLVDDDAVTPQFSIVKLIEVLRTELGYTDAQVSAFLAKCMVS